MKKLRRIAFIGGFLLLVGFCLVGWAIHEFHEGMKTDYYDIDQTPDASTMKRFTEWGYSPSISRFVQKGSSSRANGDGEKLIIYCFNPSEVPMMRHAIGSDNWVSGFPSTPWWRDTMLKFTPADLVIDASESPDHFVHVPMFPDNYNWTIMDIVRGVSYEFSLHR